MHDASHGVKEELHGVLLFVGTIWGVFFLSLLVPSLNTWGVTPRTAGGLVGVVAMPFLHADLRHLLGNTIPLLVLLTLLAGSKARSWEIVAWIILWGDALLWLFGRSATHVGASGLVFGLIAFLIVAGFLEKRIIPLFVALAVGFLFGGTLLSGILPRSGSSISWDGHLWGAVAGGLVAYALTRGSTASSQSGEESRPVEAE
ncbi:MAG: rhomboid family intramembrane serine protease [Pirellulales bacterium]